MQLLVNIQNDAIADKIIDILNAFKDDGVEIILLKKKELVTTRDKEEVFDWQKNIMTNENPDIDDDEVLPQAYWEFSSEKYTDR